MTSDQAYVTLATNDTYAKGALVLAHSLRIVSTSRSLVIMITPQVSSPIVNLLKSVYDLVEVVDVMDSKDEENLNLMKRPELGITFTKIHCWKLTQFKKCCFLDADCLVLQNIDDIFEREELSATPDIGWPDCFNSGVFVFVPSLKTYQDIVSLALSDGSYDGADQGLLNSYFSTWSTDDIKKHLPFTYNMASSSVYSYLTAYQKFSSNVKIVHFLGSVKPWDHTYNFSTGALVIKEDTNGLQCYQSKYILSWWDIYSKCVRPCLEPNAPISCGSSSSLNSHSVGFCNASPGSTDESMRKAQWDAGFIDYMGSDSFENIQAHIHAQIESAKQAINNSNNHNI